MNVPRKTNSSTLRRCLICFNSNKISSSDIYYFALPSDPIVAAQWFRNLNRNELVKNLLQKNYSHGVWICSEHFPESAVRINPLDITAATLVPGTLPLIVRPDKKKSPLILTAADRNLLFCRQTPFETELAYFRQKFVKYQHIQQYRIHCTTCDTHINLAPINKDQIQVHNFLKVIQCDECFNFDGKTGPLPVNKDLTIQCRCGVANTLVKCYCAAIYCKVCNWKNADGNNTTSKCLWCTPMVTLDLRALQWAVFKVLDFKYKSITTNEKYKDFTTERIQKLLEKDLAGCCSNVTASSVPSKSIPNLKVPSETTVSNLKKPLLANITKRSRPAETNINNFIPIKKHVVSDSVGKPIVMDKLPVIASIDSIQNTVNVPPLAPITKVVVAETIPIITSVVSFAGEEPSPAPSIPNIERVSTTSSNEVIDKIEPVLPLPKVKLLRPVKNYFKYKVPKPVRRSKSTVGSVISIPSQSRKCRPRPVLDDKCLEIKSNFKNNGTFLKTLCNHFMFKVENMQHTETSPSSVVNLHQQLISAIGDICDKLESIKEKCMQDLQKCSESQVIPEPPPLPSEEMVVSIPVVVPNDEEEDEEEIYELYDIIDTDFPECDVLIKDNSDGDEINTPEA